MGDVVWGEVLPSFERPPVVEVAAGVHFLQLPGLNTVGLVRIAEQLWGSRFPVIVEQPALPPVVTSGQSTMVAFQLQTGPPPIRLWLLSEDQALLVQLQHDRLLLNWRKGNEDAPYPRYESLRSLYSELWTEFSGYIEASDYGVLDPSFTEVSFFNRIPIADAKEIANFVRALNPDRQLDEVISTAMQLERGITTAGGPRGNQSIALSYQPQHGFLQMEITTRIGVDTDERGIPRLMESLDAAHHVGVLTFDEITTDEAHVIWGRRDDSGN